jgi:hypothetical protein
MMAGWMGAKAKGHQVVNASVVDLRTLTDGGWKRLPAFLASPELATVDLTSELPEEEPTNLQCTLNQDWDVLPEVEGRPSRRSPSAALLASARTSSALRERQEVQAVLAALSGAKRDEGDSANRERPTPRLLRAQTKRRRRVGVGPVGRQAQILLR